MSLRPSQLQAMINRAMSRSPSAIDIPYISKRQHNVGLSAGFLHILVPTSDASIEYCRTSLSAATLGYPAIHVVGWEDRYSADEFGDGAKEWGKLLATLKYLESLPQERDDDLILVIDAHDTWFQLRPEVLVRRYREITKQADQRLMKKMEKIVNERDIRTSVVFPAQRACPTGSEDDITCYAAPASPLASNPKSLKPVDTESYDDSVVDPFLRYPDPGMMLGTASSLHKLHHDAYHQWGQHPKQYPSRHSIFSLLFSNQEYLRELLYQEPRNPKSKSSSFTTTHPDPQSIITTTISPDLPNFEYGIALDYTSLLSLHSSSSAATWLNHTDTASLPPPPHPSTRTSPLPARPSGPFPPSPPPQAASSPPFPAPNPGLPPLSTPASTPASRPC
ncbi:MAG: hypothetical protein OHK93_008350 [Ramalina farinacea]|uniref:Uncharacterized protein n=1 Tax=Ramalina farinacea TaxID=258253 RepID=A0AA43QM97_9LECA|nr:hypothetical protein [Ramalina farinacea]